MLYSLLVIFNIQNILSDLEKKKGQIDDLKIKADALQLTAGNMNDEQLLKKKGKLFDKTKIDIDTMFD